MDANVSDSGSPLRVLAIRILRILFVVYPIFPVRWMMRNRYDSVAALSKATFPVMQVHGVHDQIVPIEFGRRLFDTLPTTHKHLFEMPERGHNNYGWPDYVEELKRFLDNI